MGGASSFFGSFFCGCITSKKYRENIARTLRVIVGRQYRHRDKNSIYCAALLHAATPTYIDRLPFGGTYLLEALCDGGDGGHPAGQGREHVSIWAHGAVEVPLLWDEGNQGHGVRTREPPPANP